MKCPQCGEMLTRSRFDATFKMPDGKEVNAFAIRGSLCPPCQQLYIEADLLATLNVKGGVCTFAIESDSVRQER